MIKIGLIYEILLLHLIYYSNSSSIWEIMKGNSISYPFFKIDLLRGIPYKSEKHF